MTIQHNEDADINAGLPTGKVGGLLAADVRTVLHNIVRQYDTGAVYNVQDYGAVGDGATDDSAAVIATLAAMTGSSIVGKLYFPPLRPNGLSAHYLINAPIVIGDGSKHLYMEVTGNITHVGNFSGITGNILTLTGSFGQPAGIDVFQIKPTGASSFAMRNLSIDANTDNHVGAGIRLGPNQFPVGLFENVNVVGGGYGILHDAVDLTDVVFRRCNFSLSNVASFAFRGGLQNCLWDHCVFDPPLSGGVHILGEETNGSNGNPFEGSKFHKCVFEGSQSDSFKTVPGARQLLGLIFDSCWWEANAGAFFHIDSQLGGPSMIATTFLHSHFVGSGSDNNHIIYAPAGGANSNRVFGVTFINTAQGGRGANARVLKVDATPTNPSMSHFEDIVDLDGTTISVEGDGTDYPFLRAGAGGPGFLGLSDLRSSLYGATPRDSAAGAYPKFADPRNGTWGGGTPLQIWSENGFKGALSIAENVNSASLLIGGLNGALDFASLQPPLLSADPNTTGWGNDQKGAMWFNTTGNAWKGWNGSAIKTFTVT